MIIGLGGKLSGGKTISMVRFAYRMGLRGKKIITNIHLNFPSNIEVIELSNEEFIDFLKENYDDQDKIKSMFFNSVLMLDEVSSLLSARKSTTILNELVTNFLMMAGKLDCHVIYTFQIKESQVDKRLREISQVYGNCYRINANTGIPIIEGDRILSDKVLIMVVLEYDFDILGLKTTKEVFDPSPYFNMYNTREVVLLDRSKYMRGGKKDLIRS